MSTSKLIVAVSILSLIATGTAVYEAKQIHRLNAETAILNRDCAVIRSELKTSDNQQSELERQRKATQTQIASLEHELEMLKKVSAMSETTDRDKKAKGETPSTGAGELSSRDLFFTDPEYQELILKQQAASFGLRFRAFYQKLHLSSQQISEFERIMAEQSRALFDASSAAKTQGLSVNDPHLTAITNEINMNVGKQLYALLGDGIQQVGPYYQTLNAQAKVNQLAGYLYATDAPLTLEKGEQLKQVLAANTDFIQPAGLWGTEQQTNFEAVMAQVGKVLSPKQVEVFRAMATQVQLTAQKNKRSLQLLQTGGNP